MRLIVACIYSFVMVHTCNVFKLHTVQWCHRTISLRPRSVEAGLLQHSTRRSPSIDSSTVVTCSTHGSTSRARSEATWPHQFQSTTTALVANRWTSHKLCLLVHNAAVEQAPAYITDLLQPATTTSSRSSLRAASRGDYVVPRTNRRLTDRAFSTAAPWAWNQLLTYS